VGKVFKKRTVRDYDIDGKKVLVCVDYNVPLDSEGNISDDSRIHASIDTLRYLIDRGCKLILMSHLGRPKSRDDVNTSLLPVRNRLADILGIDVWFAEDCIGEKVKTLSDHLEPGHVLLLENVRYHPEEEENNEDFSRKIVEDTGAEIYVQECFGTAHRAHASTSGVPKLLPAVAGFLVEREVSTITQAMSDPDRPLLVIVGGAKISDKIDILHRFIEIADAVAVVGAMANTFLAAQGISIGDSMSEHEEIDTARDIMEKAREKSLEQPFTFFVPKDVVVAKAVSNEAATRVVDLSHHNWADITSYPKRPENSSFEVQSDEKILDIGPFSAAYIAGIASQAKMAIWNGTAGVTETKGLAGATDPFSHGTRIIVDGLVGERGDEKNHPFTIVGGGDTVSYVESVAGLRERFGHVSTGGGASLDLMSGKDLPGVSVLWDKES
jgi:phosphoglycerate kinase